MVKENGDFVQDGADEKMLGTDEKETLALKNIEVKFISGDHTNGDAKIDIGNVEKVSWQMLTENISGCSA
jgi:solute carrier family 3, member 2